MRQTQKLATAKDLNRRRTTVASGFVGGMLAALPATQAHTLLADARLPLSVLSDRTARVAVADYAALYNRVVDALDDEGFGLFSSPLRRGTFEFLCRAVLGSRTLGEALQLSSSFLHLVLTDMTFSVTSTNGATTLEIAVVKNPRGGGTGRVFAYEWLLRWVHSLACWLVGKRIGLDSVDFPYAPPAHAEDYALIYTEHARFGGETLIARLSSAVLDLPVIRQQDSIAAFLEGAPGKIALLYRRDQEMARLVKDVLRAALPSLPDLNEVARQLHYTPRTVQRRLTEEGTSFSEVKSVLRRDLATATMERSH